MKTFLMRTVVVCLCALAAVGGAAAQAPAGVARAAGDRAAKIDALMKKYAECCSYTGTVLVTDHDKVIFKSGYGMANREWAIPNAPDVKFRLGSITKQFTSMLILQQVAAGRIKLDGHLSDYLPDYRKDTGSKVTITNLLNHTSGIPSYTSQPNFFKEVSRMEYGVDEFVKKYCSGDLEFEPGTKYRYDNSGYFLLGAVLEHVTGKKYEVLLKENIFGPLGMMDTGYDHFETIIPKRASGYETGIGKEVKNASFLDMSLPYAAGSLYSTVEDMYKWDQALYTDKLVSAELKQKAFTPGLSDYGFGWVITTIPKDEPGGGQTMIAHGGGINGFNTMEERLVGDHDLILVFNNTPGVNLSDVTKGIRAILYGKEPAEPKRSVGLDVGMVIMEHGVDAGLERYRDIKKNHASEYNLNERELNGMGYEFLQAGRNTDAIAIFKLNTEEYPKSSNAYDSLAEAYAANGQKELAIANYKKALELDPKNENATNKLKELQK